MRAGILDQRVTILRRRKVPDGAGNERGGYVAAFARFARWAPLGGRREANAGLVEGLAEAAVTLRADTDTRTVTVADRVALGTIAAGTAAADLDADSYAIIAVDPPARRAGTIMLRVTRQRV